MPTLVYNTGFESGYAGANASPANKPISAAANAAIASTLDSPITGTYHLRCSNSGGSTSTWSYTLATTAQIHVIRFKFKWVLPNVLSARTCIFNQNSSIGLGLFLNTSNQIEVVNMAAPTTVLATSAALTQGQVYRFDLRNNVSTSAHTYDVQIDGTTLYSGTGGGSASGNVNAITLGCSVAQSGQHTFCYDDLAVSRTTGDFPLGDGYGGVLRPSSLVVATTGTFTRETSATAIDSTDWARIDDTDITTTSDFIRQTAGSSNLTTGHPVVGFSHSNTDTINGVRAILAYAASANQACNYRAWVTANSVESYLHGSSSTQPTIGQTALGYSTEQVANGGVAWTDAMLDGLTFKFGTGGGTDASPNPYTHGFLLEIDYAPPSGTNFTQTLGPDAEGLTDAAQPDWIQGRILGPDAEGLTDAVTQVYIGNKTITDAFGLNDQASQVYAAVQAATDPLGLADGLTYSLFTLHAQTVTEKIVMQDLNYLLLPGALTTSFAQTADNAALRLTASDAEGEMWMTVLDGFTHGSVTHLLVAKIDTLSVNAGGWYFSITTTGAVRFLWGTGSTNLSAISSELLQNWVSVNQLFGLKWTWVRNNGSSVWEVKFWINRFGTWEQFGNTVTGVVLGVIGSVTQVLRLGADIYGNNGPHAVRMHSFTLRDGIGGTVLTDPDWSNIRSVPAATANITDSTGKVWLRGTSTSLGRQVAADLTAVQAITDAEGLADAATQVSATQRSQTDAEGLVDAMTQESFVLTEQTLTDAEGLTDAATRVAAHQRPQTDAEGLTDAMSSSAALARAPVSALGLSDALTSSVQTFRVQTDAEGLADALTFTVGTVRSLAELVGLTDAASTQLGAVRLVLDQQGLADSLNAVNVSYTILMVYTASGWVETMLTRWDGVGWVPVTLQRWTGLAWEPV